MEEQLPKSILNIDKKFLLYILGGIFLVWLFYFLVFSAPMAFNKEQIINVKTGTSLRALSLQLKNAKIIRSRVAFESFIILYGGEKRIIPADYLFESRLPVFEVARRIAKGERNLAPIRVTIPEGFTTLEIADLVANKLSNFNKDLFLEKTKDKEGYLFPDTYFFFSDDAEDAVIKAMSENFKKKLDPIRGDIVNAHKTEKEIIIMASLVEGEAKGDDDRELISGILWRRLSIGMALQVDVAPVTYEKRGLPDSPIGNPGMLSIIAAINPEKSPYLYYLHDKNGDIHFAKNFEEHKANILKYLK